MSFYDVQQIQNKIYDDTHTAERVEIVDGSGNQITSFGGGTQYTDGGTPPTHPVAPSLVYDNGGVWQHVSTASPLPVTSSGGGGGLSVTDEAAFAAGTSSFTPNGGVYNDTATALTSGQQGTQRLTTNRAGHVNLRSSTGTEIGTSSTPVQVSLANTATNSTPVKIDGSGVTQPVSAASLPLPTLAATSTKQSDGSQKTQLVDAGNNATATTFGSTLPASGQVSGFSDGTNMRPAYVAAFHNADNQTTASNQYGLLTGGVAQILNPSGTLDRQRGTSGNGIPAVGIATGSQQLAGPSLSTTFAANVTGNTSAQSVQVASSASVKVGDMIVTQDNVETVEVTAIADSTHVTGIFKNNHTSGQTLTWYHYNQAVDSTVGDGVAFTGIGASGTYLMNTITSLAEQERSAAGELDGASGKGTAIAAGYEWNAGGPFNGTAPSGNQFDRERSIQAKGLGAGSISNNPLAAASTSLTLNAGPTTLIAGQQIILDRAGTNPEANYVGTGYTPGSTTVPLQVATAFSHAQNSTVEWDQFVTLGPGLNGFLGGGLGIDDDVHYDPLTGKYFGDIAATANGNAYTSLPLRAIGVDNGSTMDRLKGINGAVQVGYGAPATSTATWTTATSLNTTLAQTITNYGTVTISSVETGTTTTAGALTFEVYDGTNWWAMAGQQISTLNPPISSYTLVNGTNVAWTFDVAGFQQFRVRLSTAITGTGSPQVVLIMQAMAAPNSVGEVVGLAQQLDSTNDAVSAWTKGLTRTKMTASGSVVSGTCLFYGYFCEASSSGTAQFFDNTAGSGDTVGGTGTAVTLTAGTNVLFPQGVIMTTGLYFTLGGTSATLGVLTRAISK